MPRVFMLTSAAFAAPVLALAMPMLPPPGLPASSFPKPDRPVAAIVSASWGDRSQRDKADEVRQLSERMGIKRGMTVANIGAGDGYDSLRLASVVGPQGSVVAEDITRPYLDALARKAKAANLRNIRLVRGEPHDPRLAPGSLDVAIMVHMYHEIQTPYALLYNLAPAFKTGGLLGIEELDRSTARHGTPPALLKCELTAVGYRLISTRPLQGDLGYFAVFAAPSPQARPDPRSIKACRAPMTL